MYRLSNIKIPLHYNDDLLLKITASHLSIDKQFIKKVKIIKKSLDARKKDNIHYLVSLAVDAEIKKKSTTLELYKEPITSFEELNLPHPTYDQPIVVVGLGPSGLFSSYLLATLGYKVIIIERGKPIEERMTDVQLTKTLGIINPNSNIQYGEGGAGTFSDGKLNTNINSDYIQLVLAKLVELGAPTDILFDNKPHIGTDKLSVIIRTLRQKLLAMGAEIIFSATVTQIIVNNSRICGVKYTKDGVENSVMSNNVIMAIGHSARDTYRMLNDCGVSIESKPFSIGVRIEHLKEKINISQYGANYDVSLPTASYKMATHLPNGRSLYTFCMCPGGEVVCGSTNEGIVTNGMSYHARDGRNSNSAILVNVTQKDFNGEALGGIAFQEKYEKLAYSLSNSHFAPVVRLGDFLNNKVSSSFGEVMPTYRPGTFFGDIRRCLPDFCVDTLKAGVVDMDKKLHGFASPDALLTGIETRSSAPIRFLRDDKMMSNIQGLYMAGEGAGYAGGIISAAVDGLKIAAALLNNIQT